MSSIGDWPHDLAPYRWEFYLQPNTHSFQSPITRTRQVLEGQGMRWIATGSWRFVDLRDAGRRKAQRFEALLDKLRGQVNTVNVFDFAACGGPLGTNLDMSSIEDTFFSDGTGFSDGDSPPTVTPFDGGSAGVTVWGGWDLGGRTVLVSGFPQNTTQLLAGDQVGLGGFLYRLTEDAEADGLNRAYLTLNRPLITALEHGDPVTRTRPRTPMQLLDDDQSRRGIDAVSRAREWTVTLIETFF